MIYLNNNQPPDELNKIYGEWDYYAYLRSDEFREAFLKPLAERINHIGLPCLDVGCGEGWLADYVTVPYTGFDGSETGVATASRLHPDRTFHVARMESPDFAGQFGTVVFGNVMDVLVRPDSYVPLLELYRRRFNANYLIVYELERFNAAAIEAEYRLIDEFHGSVVVDGLQEVKRHRKILVFQCG